MNALLGVLIAPLLLGVINRTKAAFAGRTGPPLLQRYFDIVKLLRKGAVYSRSTTWVFRAGPIVGLAAALTSLLLVPFAGTTALVAFPGDIILFAYLLGLARFATVLAALDTASSFEGMGASREVAFAALAEPALLLGLAAIARQTGESSLSGMLGLMGAASWSAAPATLVLVCAALFVVFLAENSRVPVDDPNTHLELTMIHEVMVLDHCGVDLAFIEYAASLKMWALGALLVAVAVPVHGQGSMVDLAAGIAGMLALAAVVGVVESTMARLRLVAVPRMLVGAVGLSMVALLLVIWK